MVYAGRATGALPSASPMSCARLTMNASCRNVWRQSDSAVPPWRRQPRHRLGRLANPPKEAPVFSHSPADCAGFRSSSGLTRRTAARLRKASGRLNLESTSHLSDWAEETSAAACGTLTVGRREGNLSLLSSLAAALTLPWANPSGAEAAADAPCVLVTGASSGVGQACAHILAQQGCRVILGCRTTAKGLSQRESILEATPGARVLVPDKPLELLDLEAVAEFAAAVRDSSTTDGSPLDGLLLCAGVDGISEGRTLQGLEQHISINHLGGFLLTAELRGLLEASDGSVVNFTSSAALDCLPEYLGDINWQSHRFDRRQAYCLSKACCILSADELTRRAQGRLVAYSVDPGPSVTQIVRYTQPQRAKQRQGMTQAQLEKQATQLGMRTALQAATLPAQIALGAGASSEESFVPGGLYLGAAAPPGQHIPLWDGPIAWRSPELAASVWDQSVRLTQPYASPAARFE